MKRDCSIKVECFLSVEEAIAGLMPEFDDLFRNATTDIYERKFEFLTFFKFVTFEKEYVDRDSLDYYVNIQATRFREVMSSCYDNLTHFKDEEQYQIYSTIYNTIIQEVSKGDSV